MQSTTSLRTIALCGLVCALLVGLAGCDRIRSTDTIMARGEQQIQDGNFRGALGDFKTVLQRDAEHVPARVAMARTLLFLGDFDGARAAIDTAIARGAKDAASIALKYEVLIWQNQFQEVLDKVSEEQALPAPQQKLFAARSHFGLKQVQEAQAALDEVLAADSKNETAQILEANLHAERGAIPEAIRTLDSVLESNKDSIAAWFAKGRLTLATGDLKEAKTALTKAHDGGKRILNWREQGMLYALLAEIALLDRDADAAAGWLDAMNVRLGQNVVGMYMRARLAMLRNNPDEAIAQLQRATAANDYPPALLLLAGIHISKGNYGQAETQLNRLLARDSHNLEARKLLAQIYLGTGRLADARRILPAENETHDPQLDWLLGHTLFASGSQAAGIDLLEKSFATNPKDVTRGLQLARAYLSINERDKAIALLRALPAEKGDSQRQGLLVLASVLGKSRAEGNKEIDALLALYPKDSMLFAAAGSLMGRFGDNPRAAELLNKSIAIDGSNVEARMAFAAVSFANRQYDQAAEQLRAVIALDAKNATAYSSLARVALARDDKVEATKLFEQAIGVDASATEPRLQLAQLALAARDFNRAGGLLDQAELASQGQPAVINAAGMLMFRAQQYEDALVRFDRAAAAGDVQAKFNAARVELALNRRTEARQRLSAIANDPTMQLQAVTELAKFDVEDGRIEMALNRAASLRRRPDSAAAADELEGDIYIWAKQLEKAAPAYERAYRKGATQRLALKQFQVAMTLSRPNPVAPLLDWLRRMPKDFAVRKVLAKYYVATGASEPAIREYETWLRDSNVRDPEMLNDLAWLYGEKGDNRALDIAKEAYEGLRDAPAIADTYGWLLLRRGNVKEALQILESAAKAAQNNPEIQYHYASALVRAGRAPDARTELQRVLSNHPQFPSRKAAQQLLDSTDNRAIE
ncbi:MAG TPA: XrtA/PEP-CTERM system TPR-repeat protein PrsT [Steroidobacteraceae bacterium]|nr:XrtA/PEP-CTERM system TPR-repeat protein PrsT [Steroidobacteraceae bacterium]